MSVQTILEQNWNYTYFEHNNLKAMIGIASNLESLNGDLVYTASVLDNERNELFNREFKEINSACHYLNQKYSGVWEFKSLEKPVSSGGCSTCVAH